MSDEFAHAPLGKIAKNLDAYRRPVKESERIPGPYPYYGAQGVVDHVNGFLFEGEFVLVAEDGENLRSRKQPVALLARGRFWVNNHAHVLQGSHKADTRFLLYAINSADISSYVTGSTIPKLSQTNLNRILVPCPPLNEQQAITAILGVLDDKIDLNRRMNETLEAMARAIFKDWFVDFGPTRAKMEGREPYLSPDVWSLFPDRLDDDGKPEGWQFEPLLDHANLISGGTPKTEVAAYWGGSIAWASAKDVSQCSDTFLVSTERSITALGLSESSTRLVPRLATVVVARGATTGRFRMLGSEMAMNQTCYALVSRSGHPCWLNCIFQRLVGDLLNAAHGSVFDTITTATIAGVKALVAYVDLLDRFERLVTPIFDQALANITASQSLAATRDLLLPKLMSGEIRIKDAENVLEDVL